MHPYPALAFWCLGAFSVSVLVRHHASGASDEASSLSLALHPRTGSPYGSPSGGPAPRWIH